MNANIQQNKILELNKALDSGMFVHVRRILHNMPACDIALLLESTPSDSRNILWQLTNPEQHGEILEELNEDAMESILENIDIENLVAVTETMDSNDLAYVLRNIPDEIYQELLNQMDAQDRHRVETALSYTKDTAGNLMNTNTITIRPDVSVEVVLRYLRMRKNLPNDMDFIYVVDDNDLLLGGVPLTSLIVSNPETNILDLLDKNMNKILVDTTENDVAQLFERYNLISAPVVDIEGHLLGRINIDDVVDVIRENTEHSMMGMAGMDDDEDTFAPVIKSTQNRTVWLAINLITALIASAISNIFENTLDKVATLAVLMTIVPSMGGIAGNQTLALVIRGLAVGHIGKTNYRWLVAKESAIGVLNGLIWAVIVAGIVAYWKNDWQLGFIISVAMFVNLLVAGFSGVIIPLTMKKLRIDPALAGGVVLTTITDVIGIFVFLGMASLMIT